MSTADPAPIVLHADKEHGGLRLVVFFGLFIAYILGFQLIGWLIDTFAPAGLAEFGAFLSCIGAFPLALVAVWGMEKLLTRVWHSGLSVQLDQQGIAVKDTRHRTRSATIETAPTLLWDEQIRLINWHFGMDGYPRGGRERRIDKKWSCLASELTQGETRMIIYSFLPPAEAKAFINEMAGTAPYRELEISDVYDDSLRSRIGPPSRPTIPTNVLHGKDGRYWLAERRRWEAGIELAPKDYRTFQRELQAHQSATRNTAENEPTALIN